MLENIFLDYLDQCRLSIPIYTLLNVVTSNQENFFQASDELLKQLGVKCRLHYGVRPHYYLNALLRLFSNRDRIFSILLVDKKTLHHQQPLTLNFVCLPENMNCSAKVELPYNERSWYVYVIVSVGIYLSGFFFILIGRVLWKVFKKWQFQLPEDEKDSRKPMEEYKTWYLQLKEFAVNLDTGKSFLGKCLVSLYNSYY